MAEARGLRRDLAYGAAINHLHDAEDQLKIVRANVDALFHEDGIEDEKSLQRTQLEAFHNLAAEAKYYVDRWPKLAPDLLKRLAEMCPEGREWNPTEGE